jgi:hypothetical protein
LIQAIFIAKYATDVLIIGGKLRWHQRNPLTSFSSQ